MPELAEHVSATQAARMIGVNERTVRLWIQQGKLSARQLAANRLAVPLSEIERIIRERETHREGEHLPGPRELARQVKDLRAGFDALREQPLPGSSSTLDQDRLESIERRLQRLEAVVFSAGTTDTPRAPVARQRPTPRREQGEDRALPEGCILLRDFAMMYGVNPNTARDHATIGIGRGDKDRLEVSERLKPGRSLRPGGNRAPETERYLTPEQQRAALAYWQRHSVPYQEPLIGD